MKGAREFNNIIKLGVKYGFVEEINSFYGWYKSGNLVMLLGKHARGQTLTMYVVPDNFDSSCIKYYSIGEDNLKVYGVISGQIGWTEVYGWMYKGAWIEYFEKMIQDILDRKLLMESYDIKLADYEKMLQEIEFADKINRFNKLFL